MKSRIGISLTLIVLSLVWIGLPTHAWAQPADKTAVEPTVITTKVAPVPGATEPLTATPAAEKMVSADFRAIVKKAKDKVFPSVVFIRNLRESYESGRKTTGTALGSGALISPTGLIVSNWHVIDKAKDDKVFCLLSDGSHYEAKIVGSDKDTDISVLQLQVPKGKKVVFPSATFGPSVQLKEGDFVMAMGAPYGMNRSVSIGIISCTKRYLPENSEYSKWMQTDAMISPGNSGGPLVDTSGKIIGINTRGGGGHGFAVPSEIAKLVVQRIQKYGKVNWSWTGLRLQPLKNFMKDIYFDGDKGVIIASIDPESPAAKAGVKVQDLLLEINGKDATATWDEDLPAVRRTLGLLPMGKPAKLKIRRGKKELTLTITPREKGKVEGEEQELKRWDFTVKAINQFDNEDLYFYQKKGVFIFGIKQPGNALISGLRPKDIILKVGKKEIKSLDDLTTAHEAAMSNMKKTSRILITVQRNGMVRQCVLDFARDFQKE